jgi:hypothetical protein
MCVDGQEIAILDLREELIFSRGHLLHARSLPLSRLELRMARLVPRRDTRIVLCDDADGLAERASAPWPVTATPTCSSSAAVSRRGQVPVSSYSRVFTFPAKDSENSSSTKMKHQASPPTSSIGSCARVPI